MDNFWPSLVSSLFGAIIGAGSALGAAEFNRRREERRTELLALDGLLSDLHFRRAVYAIPNPIVVPSPSDDREQANLSVLNMRDAIRDARRQLRLGSNAFGPLHLMTRACNVYLESVQIRAERFQFFLQDLRASLAAASKQLTDDEPKLNPRVPGDGAL